MLHKDIITNPQHYTDSNNDRHYFQLFSMMFPDFALNLSNFYRKIKGVLDLSPNEYLRLERLKKAAQLLKEGENRVNEICYMVGFNSPSYFAKCFQKQFGVLPKDFVS